MLSLKHLDRVVALSLVAFFVAYLYLSFNFELLPFERRMSFKPDTLPKGIGVLGLILSLSVLFTTRAEENKDNKHWRQYDYKRGVAMVLAMILYATLLKPAGFVVATMAFLIAGAMILGEKKMGQLVVVALIGSVSIWLIVDKLLGIYLYPVPAFIQL